MTASAFLGTNPTDDLITSGLPAHDRPRAPSGIRLPTRKPSCCSLVRDVGSLGFFGRLAAWSDPQEFRSRSTQDHRALRAGKVNLLKKLKRSLTAHVVPISAPDRLPTPHGIVSQW